MSRLLRPGAHRTDGAFDDTSVIETMLDVEVAWAGALEVAGVVSQSQAQAVAAAAADLYVDVDALAAATEGPGNPVTPLVALLRAAVGDGATGAVHSGLTSQDVLDTTLVLLAQGAVLEARIDLCACGDALARLARDHRDSVAVARTLTQWAVPTTFGLRAAQWLAGLTDAVRVLDGLTFPVQYGGAAGTRALLAHLAPDADQSVAVAAFAARLGLDPVQMPWHTRRGHMTAIGDALTTVTDSLGVLANDVLLLGRPEVAEMHEARTPERGGSSTMPHKQNPVLSVLVAAAARRAPLLAAQLHLAAAGAVDERPDGAWHSEWPALTELLGLAVTAAAQAAELAAGLHVDAAAMARRAESAASALLSERGGGDPDVRSYLGAAGQIADAAVAAWERTRG